MHKISDEFEFGSGRIFHSGVVRPLALTLNGENGVSIFTQLL